MIPTLRDAAQQALEALDYWMRFGETPGSHDMIQKASVAIKERLK